jgi:dihydrofolate reductase
MRQLAIVEFVTLDGVMQSLGGPDEDREGGFAYGGWSAPYGDEVLGRQAGQGIGQTSAYLFGRRTYEHMAAHWPNEPDDNPIAASLNATPKYVVTRSLRTLDWTGSHVLAGDVAEEVQALKATGEGFITVLGSGVLVQTLLAEDLVDVYRVFIHPLVLGTGKRLFREMPHPLRLCLVDCTPTGTGVLLCSYERAADPADAAEADDEATDPADPV